ncbi:beta-eliminating lyase-related protein [Streptomyces sp. NPDC004647]|uniref:beta-eliminating lyase-related protein n=1 Tax=Streptomyces sp. NPDC004647 TaxID=3154671 RepID=UPI0033B83FDC
MTDTSADEKPARRLTAWNRSDRILAGGPSGETIAQRLEQLVAHAPDSYDLIDWTDIYGNGVVSGLERRVAGLLGTEAAAFFPTGTMAQQVALRCWAGRTGSPTVAIHPLAHPEVWERDALSMVSGLRTVHPTTEPRLPTAAEVRDLDEPFGTLMLELPLRDAGFVLPSWEELTAVVVAAREREAVVHIDGARLWECAPHFRRALPEIAALADSACTSRSTSRSAVCPGPRWPVRRAWSTSRRPGGTATAGFQQWPAALAALAGLDRELPRLPECPAVPHTHQFQVWLPHPAEVLNEAGVRQAEETRTTLFRTWEDAGVPGLAKTELTVAAPGLEWTEADVAEAVAGFLERVERVERAARAERAERERPEVPEGAEPVEPKSGG